MTVSNNVIITKYDFLAKHKEHIENHVSIILEKINKELIEYGYFSNNILIQSEDGSFFDGGAGAALSIRTKVEKKLVDNGWHVDSTITLSNGRSKLGLTVK